MTNAEKLTQYIKSLPGFPGFDDVSSPNYASMGAIIIDGILQAGINYQNVVLPRVVRFGETYPHNKTVQQFKKLAEKEGFDKISGWQDAVKLRRMQALTDFLLSQNVDTVEDFKHWFSVKENKESLLTVNGVGTKTRDYLCQRAGGNTSAIDVHLCNFIKQAGITVSDYDDAQKIISETAKILGVKENVLDGAIWLYMSK